MRIARIRPAALEDVPACVAMGARFQRTVYQGVLAENRAQLEALARQLVTGPDATLLVAEAAAEGGPLVGLIGLVAYPHHVSGDRMAGEVAYWLEPEARGDGAALLEAAEAWARAQGACALQLVAPEPRVGRLYERHGYRLLELTYQKALAPSVAPIRVFDDVLEDVAAYRAAALAGPFGPVETSPGCVFQGIGLEAPDTLARWLVERVPTLQPALSFFRLSPAGQVEPNYIHTDRDMGQWTAILYLTAEPAPGDGTTFWRRRRTGAIASTATEVDGFLEEWRAWRDLDEWAPWHTVEARPNRLILFPAPLFHSRALADNYGEGAGARLIQVVFGTGALPAPGG